MEILEVDTPQPALLIPQIDTISLELRKEKPEITAPLRRLLKDNQAVLQKAGIKRVTGVPSAQTVPYIGDTYNNKCIFLGGGDMQRQLTDAIEMIKSVSSLNVDVNYLPIVREGFPTRPHDALRWIREEGASYKIVLTTGTEVTNKKGILSIGVSCYGPYEPGQLSQEIEDALDPAISTLIRATVSTLLGI